MNSKQINLLDNPFALLSREEYEWGEEHQDYCDIYDDGYPRSVKKNQYVPEPDNATGKTK